MNQQQIQELSEWLNSKLRFVNAIIKEAQTSHNYGKETQYIGMREAYKECLKRLDNELPM